MQLHRIISREKLTTTDNNVIRKAVRLLTLLLILYVVIFI